jgi:hypothetical protein
MILWCKKECFRCKRNFDLRRRRRRLSAGRPRPSRSIKHLQDATALLSAKFVRCFEIAAKNLFPIEFYI